MALAPRLPKLVSAAKAFWWGNVGNSAQGLAIVDVDSDTLRLNYVDAPLDVLQELLRDVRLLAGAMGQSRLKAKPVRSAGTADAFSAAGWAVEDDRSMLVFARSLDTGSPARSKSSALDEEQ